MPARYHVPARVRFSTEVSPDQRTRIEEAVLAAVRGSLERAAERSEVVTADVVELPARAAERFSRARYESRARTYALPSYEKEGASEQLPVTPTEVEGRPDYDEVHTDGFETRTVMRLIGNRYIKVGGSPFLVTTSLLRAEQWGKSLFGGSGFAIFEAKDNLETFTVVGLLEPLSIAKLGGLGSLEPEAGHEEWREVREEGSLIDQDRYYTVAVTTHDDVRILSRFPWDRWTPRRFEETLAAARKLEPVDPRDVRAAAASLLGTGKSAAEDKVARALLVNMDRTMFALVPWEQRARYLRLLILGATLEEEEIAIVEILRATSKLTELDAIFGLLRGWQLHRKLFDDLSPGRAFEALQVLGEHRGIGHLDFEFFVALWQESLTPSIGGIILDPERLLEEPGRVYEGLLDWVAGTLKGVWFLLSEPDQLIKAIPAIFEFALLIARARLGDPKALATIANLLRQAGVALVNATRGAEYVEELGRPFSKRSGTGARVAGDLIGRVRTALILEVLSFFVGIGEIKAVYSSVRSGKTLEQIGAAVGTLSKTGRGVRAVEVAADAAKLERTLNALRALAGVTDEVRVARLAEHLTQDQLSKLARIAERANLTEGASIDALRLAVAADKQLAGAADEVAAALKIVSRVEEKLGGKIGPEAAAGLRNLMESAPWSFDHAARLVDELPVGSAEEFMRALRFVSPGHFRRWGPTALETIAKRPKSIRFLADAGPDIFESVYETSGKSWERFERVVDGVDLRKAELNDPAEYQRLLDRLGQRDASAFEEAAGARLRVFQKQGPSAQARTLVGNAVGDAGKSLDELTEAERRAALLAADLAPEATRRAVAAEIEGALPRALDELDAALYNAGMSQADVDATGAVIKKLNDQHLALRNRDDLITGLARVAEVGDPRALSGKVDEYLQELAKLHKRFLDAGDTGLARAVERRMQRLRDIRSGKLGDASLEAFEDAVRTSTLLWRHTSLGNADILRRLWLQYWSRATRPRVDFEEYVSIISRHFRGNYGEWEVAFRLGESHIFLKAPDRLVTLPGTDLVAIARGGDEVLLIDNKAFLGLPEIDNVNALTRNLPKNLSMDLTELGKLAGRQDLPTEFSKAMGKLQRARDDIASKLGTLTREQLEDPKVQAQIDAILKEHGVRRVVTNAGGVVQGISAELRAIGLELMDLN